MRRCKMCFFMDRRPRQAWAAKLHESVCPYFANVEPSLIAMADPLQWRPFVLNFSTSAATRAE